MNRILTEKPSLDGNVLEYGFPRQTAQILRAIFIASGLVTASLIFKVWDRHPSIAVIFLCCFSFLLLLMALHPRLGKARIYFVAGEEGLFFPHNEGGFLIPKSYASNWLYMPWANVIGIREGLVATYEGLRIRGLVLRVNASPDERMDYLHSHIHLDEKFKKRRDCNKSFEIGYVNIMHSAKNAATTLLKLKHKHQLRHTSNSSQATA